MSAATEQEINIEDGKLVPAGPTLVSYNDKGEKVETKVKPVDTSRLENVCELISDPEADPAEISRLITAELAVVTKEMASARNEPTSSETWKSKTYSEVVKALRELGKQLMDTEVLSKKDILNFDGLKFQFALSRIVELFVKSMKEAGMPEDQRTNVMKHYRDLMAIAEPNIRRETLKIDSSLRGK